MLPALVPALVLIVRLLAPFVVIVVAVVGSPTVSVFDAHVNALRPDTAVPLAA